MYMRARFTRAWDPTRYQNSGDYWLRIIRKAGMLRPKIHSKKIRFCIELAPGFAWVLLDGLLEPMSIKVKV